MKKIALVCIVYLTFIHSMLNANNSQPDLKTSIIIPCAYNHAVLLHPLLKLYELQTVVPNEIVISLSEAHLVPAELLANLQNEPWSFSLLLLLSNDKQHAGMNRNIACQKATGDILICQDADDLPHPQRVQFIKYCFQHYDLDHLMHEYLFSHQLERFPTFTIQNIELSPKDTFDNTYKNNQKLHNGCPSFRKYVCEKVQWPNAPHIGEDIAFNKRVYALFTKCMALKIPLYIYRNQLSSWAVLPNSRGQYVYKDQLPSCPKNNPNDLDVNEVAYWKNLYTQFLAH